METDTVPRMAPGMTPTALIIDADEQRAQCVARMLTLAECRSIVTSTPLQAFKRLLQERITPAVLLGGTIAATHRLTLTRMTQQIRQQHGDAVPMLQLPDYAPEVQPVVASPLAPYSHTFSQACFELLDAIWAAPTTVAWGRTSRRGVSAHPLTLTLLPAWSCAPRVSQRLRSRNSHFRQVLHAAYELIGSLQWETAVTDVGLAQYARSEHWPPDDNAQEVPAEYLSLLNQAVAFSAIDNPTQQLRNWGDLATRASLERRMPSGLTQQALRLLPQERVVALTLKSFCAEMDAIRGEPLHIWRQLGENRYLIAHYSNLYIYGRYNWLPQAQPACHVWLGSYEATLRAVRLDTTWQISELECSHQTLTGHCVFALTQRRAA